MRTNNAHQRANNIRKIRERLSLTQIAFANAICVSQSSVSNYEHSYQAVPPEVAHRVISIAHERGLSLTFDDVYLMPDRAE